MKQKKLLSLILIAAGAVLLIIGIYQFVEFRNSMGGKLASFGNQVGKALGGSSSIAKGYVQPIILMVGGIASACAGFFISKKG